MTKYHFTEDEYGEAIKVSLSIADVCRFLGVLPRGGNYGTIKKYIAKYDLDVSHFTGHAHAKGKIFNDAPKYKKGIKRNLLANRGHQCESCKNTDWMGLPITLEIEHVDGNNTNNIDSNLLLLCPNCHSQTKTWRRAKSSFSTDLSPKTSCKCGNTKQSRSITCIKCRSKKATDSKEIMFSDKREQKFCSCGNAMSKGAKQCSECLHKAQKRIVWPTPEELVERLHNKPYTTLGKELGVSDNAIRKYLRKNGIDPKTFRKL